MSDAFLVLKSGSCAWGRCLFCGYGRIQGELLSLEGFREKLDGFFKSLDSRVDHVKVYGSGSFLDEKQVSGDLRAYFIERCLAEGVKKVTVESRPEFISREKIREFRGLELEVATGLEIACDEILDRISKGFHLSDFEKAVSILHEEQALVRTYLLVNLPFVKNLKESLEESVNYALKYSDSIVLINLLPHGHTPLFRMWLSGVWRFLSREEFHNLAGRYESHPKIELDVETFRFVPLFPRELRENLSGVGERYLTHPHFEVWQDYILRWYRPPSGKKTLLFLPCSYTKPYSRSRTHRGIINVLIDYKGIHEVMLSNAGVVPREFEDYYPFNSYDWDESKETGEIKERYIGVTKERIIRYLQTHGGHYRRVLCFLGYESESFKALREACNGLGMECKNLLSREREGKRVLQSGEALEDLRYGVENEAGKV
ncbi:MAG: hypothetical protein B6U72_03685 [Candidatus Altiarchaeales archaeon ex4484_2]|nr:MAG: hypothetical protein B6U72_03685 [Candidatus Altiarchaeales archaeon ex4484_2]